MKRFILLSIVFFIYSFMLVACGKENNTTSKETIDKTSVSNNESKEENKKKKRKKTPLQFDKPDEVRGIYVTGHYAGGERFDKLIDLINNTDLNSMVIDIKDDYGDLTYEPKKKSDLTDFGQPYIKDPKKILKNLEIEEI